MISPRLYHGRHKRELESTRDKEEEGRHVHHLTVGWVVDHQDFVLDLKLNRELIPESYFEKYHHQVIFVGYHATESCEGTGCLKQFTTVIFCPIFYLS